MAFAEFDGIRALRQIQFANDETSGAFLKRTLILEQIRANVYLSGTFIRDFVLEPDQNKVEQDRSAAFKILPALHSPLNEYRALLRPDEVIFFDQLNQEVNDYSQRLDRALTWTAEERRKAGFAFLRDDVFPRRTSILALADRIGTLATARLGEEKLEVAAAYRTYRRRLTVTVGLTIGLGMLLAAFSIRQIFFLEKETIERYHEISNARAALQELSVRLLAAQEEERRSIARELHDEVGQALTGVLVEMANLSTLIRGQKTDALEPKATEIKKLLEDSIAVVRNLALLLRPPMLDDLGLLPALQWQARETTKRSSVRVKIAAERLPENLPDNLKTCVYRIVQEALHNVTQHAEAHTVRISIEPQGKHMYLSIQDDGKGFAAKGERGMGLLGMEERVTHLGGSFAVESAPGEGTILRVILPLAP